MIEQVSIFLENRVGMLSKFAEVMSGNSFEAVGISVADTTDFGILRLVVRDPKKAVEVFRENGFSASITKVVGARMQNSDDLEKILTGLSAEHISIEYLYSLCHNEKTIVFKVADPEKTEKILFEKGIATITDADIWGL